MRCSRDSVDVEPGEWVKKDRVWGWIHSSDEGETWHTLKGTELEELKVEVGGKVNVPVLPARAHPDLAAINFTGKLQVPLDVNVELRPPTP